MPAVPRRFPEIPPPDSHHLSAASGWLELGDSCEASAELDRVQPRFRTHPDVLTMRLAVHRARMEWKACVQIAEAIIQHRPGDRVAIISRSCALHQLKRTQDAYACLLPAAITFADCWNVPYNLACYCSQLGDFEAAVEWLTKAIAIDPLKTQRAATADPDFKPLWENMNGTLWKRIA